ncbi:MAG: DUF4956 domain-containing protein [Bilifractor sp.]|jgi:uncharacterized membrane protein YhiD involved in acid resistance
MNLFGTIIPSTGMTGPVFLICTLCSIGLGLFIAIMYRFRSLSTKSFLIALTLLPAVVQMVIMLVNGNLGVGVAVAGAFSLVRFRSATGTAKEITGIFLSMAVGLATGMGYLMAAAVFAVIVTVVNVILTLSPFGEEHSMTQILKITAPEQTDYENAFEDILKNYTTSARLLQVRTVNLGSLYRITYELQLKPGSSTKAMIDELRTRNGNLEISCGRPAIGEETL